MAIHIVSCANHIITPNTQCRTCPSGRSEADQVAMVLFPAEGSRRFIELSVTLEYVYRMFDPVTASAALPCCGAQPLQRPRLMMYEQYSNRRMESENRFGETAGKMHWRGY
jgi:hypothetical protein